jgi:lysophospholipase L1-like esterase
VLPGVRSVRSRIIPYAAHWRAGWEADAAREGPLWVVLGDSSAQGLGADDPDRGYVGQVRALLDGREPGLWRVANLSRSGARAAEVEEVQLPALRALTGVSLVSLAVGVNDLIPSPRRRLTATLIRLMRALPRGSVVATLPRGWREARARRVNDAVRREAAARGLRVADLWAHTGPPWRGRYAADGFHPNERGYAGWAAAFSDALGLGPPP